MLNYVKNNSTSENLSENISVRWDLRDVISLGVTGNVSRQKSRYAIQSNLNNTSYTSGIGADGDVRIGKLTQIKFDYSLRTTTGQYAGFNRQIHLLNASYIQYFNTKRNVWISLRGYDILKQNVSISRFVGENYIEDYQSNALTRFFLLAVNYKLNRFGAKQGNNTTKQTSTTTIRMN